MESSLMHKLARDLEVYVEKRFPKPSLPLSNGFIYYYLIKINGENKPRWTASFKALINLKLTFAENPTKVINTLSSNYNSVEKFKQNVSKLWDKEVEFLSSPFKYQPTCLSDEFLSHSFFNGEDVDMTSSPELQPLSNLVEDYVEKNLAKPSLPLSNGFVYYNFIRPCGGNSPSWKDIFNELLSLKLTFAVSPYVIKTALTYNYNSVQKFKQNVSKLWDDKVEFFSTPFKYQPAYLSHEFLSHDFSNAKNVDTTSPVEPLPLEVVDELLPPENIFDPRPSEIVIKPETPENKVDPQLLEYVVKPELPENKVETQPMEIIVEPQPMEILVEPQPMEIIVEPQPIEIIVEPQPMNNVVNHVSNISKNPNISQNLSVSTKSFSWRDCESCKRKKESLLFSSQAIADLKIKIKNISETPKIIKRLKNLAFRRKKSIENWKTKYEIEKKRQNPIDVENLRTIRTLKISRSKLVGHHGLYKTRINSLIRHKNEEISNLMEELKKGKSLYQKLKFHVHYLAGLILVDKDDNVKEVIREMMLGL